MAINVYAKEKMDAILANKVDKVSGYGLISDAQLAQITTNKNDIATVAGNVVQDEADIDNLETAVGNLTAGLNGKVDKETGKSLVSDTDIAQITTNKNDIASLGTNKQDKLIAGTNITIDPATNTISASGGSSGTAWGSITGTISNQTDLSNVLANKVDVVPNKGLSANDYTNADKAKVDALAGTSETLVFTLADDSTVTVKVAKAV